MFPCRRGRPSLARLTCSSRRLCARAEAWETGFGPCGTWPRRSRAAWGTRGRACRPARTRRGQRGFARPAGERAPDLGEAVAVGRDHLGDGAVALEEHAGEVLAGLVGGDREGGLAQHLAQHAGVALMSTRGPRCRTSRRCRRAKRAPVEVQGRTGWRRREARARSRGTRIKAGTRGWRSKLIGFVANS